VIGSWCVNDDSSDDKRVDSEPLDASWTSTNIWIRNTEHIQSFSRSEILLSVLRVCRSRDGDTVSDTRLYVQGSIEIAEVQGLLYDDEDKEETVLAEQR
jgi:hypothetical protein